MVSLQKAVDLNPRHFEAMTDLAGMLEDYGDKQAALKLYRQALALDPQLAEAARHEKSLAKELEGQGFDLKRSLLAAPFLVGSWFGIGQPDDRAAMWIAHKGADGGFAAQFRSCVKGKPLDEFETGHWRLEGDTETINIQTVNGMAAQDDAYKILSHDGQRQVYRYLRDGFVFTSHRVDEKFEMPSCEAIS